MDNVGLLKLDDLGASTLGAVQALADQHPRVQGEGDWPRDRSEQVWEATRSFYQRAHGELQYLEYGLGEATDTLRDLDSLRALGRMLDRRANHMLPTWLIDPVASARLRLGAGALRHAISKGDPPAGEARPVRDHLDALLVESLHWMIATVERRLAILDGARASIEQALVTWRKPESPSMNQVWAHVVGDEALVVGRVAVSRRKVGTSLAKLRKGFKEMCLGDGSADVPVSGFLPPVSEQMWGVVRLHGDNRHLGMNEDSRLWHCAEGINAVQVIFPPPGKLGEDLLHALCQGPDKITVLDGGSLVFQPGRVSVVHGELEFLDWHEVTNRSVRPVPPGDEDRIRQLWGVDIEYLNQSTVEDSTWRVCVWYCLPIHDLCRVQLAVQDGHVDLLLTAGSLSFTGRVPEALMQPLRG